MKKLIALAMALVMAATMGITAFAASCPIHLSSGSCEVDMDGHEFHLLPGEKYALKAADSESSVAVSPLTPAVGDLNAAFGSDAWRISANWKIGGALVKSLKWDKDKDQWMLELNENYTISTPKKLQGTITFTSKKDKKNLVKGTIDAVVTNHLVTVEGAKKAADAESIDADNNTIYQCSDDNPGYIKFNDNRLMTVVLKMVKKEKAFMFNDESQIDSITEKYGNSDADIKCYAFGGTPKFQNDAKFTLQADYSNQYFLYEYTGGKLMSVDYKWNSINGVYEWSTKTPHTYVISSKKLAATSKSTDDSSKAEESSKAAEKKTSTKPAAAKGKTPNPDTGAHDAVGVAVALAAIGLTTAGVLSVTRRK